MATSTGKATPVGERFWQKVDVGGPDDCWPWQAFRLANGYGTISENGRKRLAHRVSYQLAYGPIPDRHYILHSCDNPPCVNPAHLWAGTQQENVKDMLVKGRSNHAGEHNGGAKLTVAKVSEIKRRRSQGESTRDLAKAFGVSGETINGIKRGSIWKFVS